METLVVAAVLFSPVAVLVVIPALLWKARVRQSAFGRGLAWGAIFGLLRLVPYVGVLWARADGTAVIWAWFSVLLLAYVSFACAALLVGAFQNAWDLLADLMAKRWPQTARWSAIARETLSGAAVVVVGIHLAHGRHVFATNPADERPALVARDQSYRPTGHPARFTFGE